MAQPNSLTNDGWTTPGSPMRAVEFGWQTVMHSDDLPGLIGAFVKANDSRESFAVESRIRRYDGVYRWFLMQGSPLIDDSGTLVQWYGINTDIEDRKRAEEILAQANRLFAKLSTAFQA